MSFLRRLWPGGRLDGPTLARSERVEEYAQVDLLSRFDPPRPLHDERERRDWERILPRRYMDQIRLLERQGWLRPQGDDRWAVTPEGQALVALYRERQAQEKAAAMEAVRRALEAKDTAEALAIRRRYEARQPLGTADWTGPEPQLSHSALTRRILFLEHWLLEDLSPETVAWLKLYAAEQHLWGTTWRLLPSQIPPRVAQELTTSELPDPVEAAYWRAHGLFLYVENHDTWQRCKGGDHVRRLAIRGPDDGFTCVHCRDHHGRQYLVDRVPELPHRECTSPLGCRCVYEPVLESPGHP